jgi:hypothetical protein
MTDTSNVLKINPDDLTLGDIEMIEDISGQPIGWLGNSDKPQGKMMVAVAYAIGLRSDKAYTMDQARGMRVEVAEVDVTTPPKGESAEKSD